MKKIVLITLMTMLFLHIFYAKTIAINNNEQSAKIAVVDIAILYKNFYKAQEAEKQLQIAIESANKELGVMLEEGQILSNETQELVQMARNNDSFTIEERDHYKSEAEAKIQHLTSKQQQVEQYKVEMDERFYDRQQEIARINLLEIQEFVKSYAQEFELDYIFNASGINVGMGAILYTKSNFDITNEILQRINAEAPKEFSRLSNN